MNKKKYDSELSGIQFILCSLSTFKSSRVEWRNERGRDVQTFSCVCVCVVVVSFHILQQQRQKQQCLSLSLLFSHLKKKQSHKQTRQPSVHLSSHLSSARTVTVPVPVTETLSLKKIKLKNKTTGRGGVIAVAPTRGHELKRLTRRCTVSSSFWHRLKRLSQKQDAYTNTNCQPPCTVNNNFNSSSAAAVAVNVNDDCQLVRLGFYSFFCLPLSFVP